METILFLHGWGGDENSFAPILPFFEKQYKCLCPAMPMFQKDSKKDNPDSAWTLKDYAEFIENYLDENNIEKCHILAHSFGARVTTLLLNRNPDRYGRIILTGAAGIKKRKTLCVWLKIKSYKVRKKLFMNKKESGSTDYKKLTDEGKKTFQKIIEYDLKGEISKIFHPTLLIYGGHDTATPVKMGRKWAKLSKNSILVTYKKSGHFCYIDENSRFIKDSSEFLSCMLK